MQNNSYSAQAITLDEMKHFTLTIPAKSKSDANSKTISGENKNSPIVKTMPKKYSQKCYRFLFKNYKTNVFENQRR